jgi:hypothetical protein
MSESPRLVRAGTVGATPIMVDVTTLGSAVAVKVTLTADYVLANPRPPGFPSPPSMTGSRAGNLHFPRTLPNGSVHSFHACEATALINAGAATAA